MAYKYRLKETNSDADQFQQQRLASFDGIEAKLDTLKKYVVRAKLATDKFYRANPDSYEVVYSTDLANDYLKDLFTLFKPDEE